jgi:hypothetical protein
VDGSFITISAKVRCECGWLAGDWRSDSTVCGQGVWLRCSRGCGSPVEAILALEDWRRALVGCDRLLKPHRARAFYRFAMALVAIPAPGVNLIRPSLLTGCVRVRWSSIYRASQQGPIRDNNQVSVRFSSQSRPVATCLAPAKSVRAGQNGHRLADRGL